MSKFTLSAWCHYFVPRNHLICASLKKLHWRKLLSFPWSKFYYKTNTISRYGRGLSPYPLSVSDAYVYTFITFVWHNIFLSSNNWLSCLMQGHFPWQKILFPKASFFPLFLYKFVSCWISLCCSPVYTHVQKLPAPSSGTSFPCSPSQLVSSNYKTWVCWALPYCL